MKLASVSLNAPNSPAPPGRKLNLVLVDVAVTGRLWPLVGLAAVFAFKALLAVWEQLNKPLRDVRDHALRGVLNAHGAVGRMSRNFSRLRVTNPLIVAQAARWASVRGEPAVW